MRLSIAGLIPAILLMASTGSRAGVDLSRPTAFRDCEALISEHPRELDAYRCYLVLARRYQSWDEAMRRLDAVLARDPSNSFARLFLGALEADRGRARAETSYRAAAEGFAAVADKRGETLARLSLATFLRQRGRMTEAEEMVDRAAVTASGDHRLMTRVWIEMGFMAIARGEYSLARSQLSKAEGAAEGEEDYPLALVLDGLGAVASATGDNEEALACFAKEAVLHWENGDYYEESRVRYNIATLARRLLESGAMTAERARKLWFDALDAAMRARNLETQAAVYCLQAQDRDLAPPEALDAAQRALDAARATGNINLMASASRLVALNLILTEPGQAELAFELADKSLALTRLTGSPTTFARACLTRAYMRVISGDRPKAIAESLAALDAIERIRDLQRDDAVRARLFSEWAFAYYQLSGYLLGSPADLNAAFAVTERMRARVLLDALDAARSTAALSPRSALDRQRLAVLDQIAQLQKTLLGGELSGHERSEAVERLDNLEVQEGTLREEIAQSDPRFAVVRHPDIPAIAEVQRRLATDEMLLSFQLSEREQLGGATEGGSWLIAITRTSSRVFALPDRRMLEAQVDLFTGMVSRRDGQEAAAAAALYRDLLAPAMRIMPAAIRRLVIVPDGSLHRLPFSALRARSEGPPLIAQYDLCLVPSVTVWLRWLKKLAPAADRPAIVFADPHLVREGKANAFERLRLLDADELPGALPYARIEGRMITRFLGAGSLLLEGTDASEDALKQTDLRRYGILYFATHVVIDERNPDRSAVLLAPSPPSEDGLLQSRDIIGLRLNGQVVVLFGCRSVTGTQLRGEGVMGIARAFLQAGARTVVGSLWPLRDAEASGLSEGFCEHLAMGHDVAASLAAAQRDRMSAGAPAAAWAGLVVIGDGSAVPVSGVSGARSARPSIVMLVTIFAVIAAIATLARARMGLWGIEEHTP
ncbi:MAG: CHAT domain-containing protein [Acidobacteria bacterium]|nr:CHAT domain-containing protein [Acidobacteriota bacterium]